MKTLLCIAVVALFASSAAKGVVDSNWTRKFHAGKNVLSVHVYDTLGVSTDDSTVVVWDARDGRRIDSIRISGRGINGAWLTSTGNEIVAYVRDKEEKTWGTILWLDRKSHLLIDSIGPLFKQDYGDHFDCEGTYGSISDNNSVLFVSYTLHILLNNHIDRLTSYGQKIDLLRKTKLGSMKTIGSQLAHRFESRDRVITFTSDLNYGSGWFNSVSPSGKLQFDGKSLYDLERKLFIRTATKKYWYVGRYGPTDATAMAFTDRQWTDSAGIRHQSYVLCAIDIFRDSVLQVLDSNVSIPLNVWCDSTSRYTYMFKYDGTVAKRIADTTVFRVRPVCLNSIPDSVITDSLYLVGALFFPLADGRLPVVDRGDGSSTTTALYCSWHTPGRFTCRLGTVRNNDTVWVCSQEIRVGKDARDNGHGPRFHLEQSPIRTFDTRKEDSILIVGESGWIVACDSTLMVLGCTKAKYRAAAAYWTGMNEVQCLLYNYSWYTFIPNYDATLTLSAISGIAAMATSDMKLVDTLACSGEVKQTAWNVSSIAQSLGITSSGVLWNLVSIFSTGGSESLGKGFPPTLDGGFSTVIDGHFAKRGATSSGVWPNYNYDGQHFTAGMTSDSKYIVSLFYNYLPTAWWRTKHFALYDTDADSIVSIIKGFDVREIRCIGSNHALADSVWLDLKPFRVSQSHPFSNPFAEDAVPGHALAWKDGWFYSFHPSGTIHDSVFADTMRPTVIRVFKDGRIIAGYASGLVAIYGVGLRDLRYAPPPPPPPPPLPQESTQSGSRYWPGTRDHVDTTPVTRTADVHEFTCWPNPASSTLHCQLSTSMPLPATFEIFDMQGRLCGTTSLSAHDADVYLPSIMNMEPTGLFVVRVRSGAMMEHRSIVVLK